MKLKQIAGLFLVLGLAACSPEPVEGPNALAPQVSTPAEPAPDVSPVAQDASANQACGSRRVEQRRCIMQFEQATGAITTISEGVECTVYAPNASGHVCAMECARACSEVR